MNHCHADGSCVLTCSPANEARWFLDAGSYSNSKVWDEVPQVRCPVRLAVGGQKGTMDYLVAGAVAQLQRFPNATLKRYAITMCSQSERGCVFCSRSCDCWLGGKLA